MTSKTKVFGLAALAVFAMVLITGLASAELNVSVISAPSNVFADGGKFDLRVSVTSTVGGEVSLTSTPTSGNYNFPLTNLTVVANTPTEVSVPVTFPFANVDFLRGTVTANQEGQNPAQSPEFSIKVVKPFCEEGEKGGSLEITGVDIQNNIGDDEDWELLDEIEITVDVENTEEPDVDDVQVEIAIFDSAWNDVTDDFNLDEDSFDIGNLDESEEETVIFEFKVPADVDDGNYHIMVKAYSDDLGEENECTETDGDKRFYDVSVNRQDEEEDYIAFDDFVLSPEAAVCGERVSFSFDVFNVGEEDQERVKVNLINTDLGIDQSVELRNMDIGDEQSVRFEFLTPKNAEEGIHDLRIFAEYEYDNGDYDQSSGDDERVPFEIINCGPSVPEQLANVNTQILSSEIKAGGQLVVKATVTNLADIRNSFTVSATGYQSWATLDNISPPIINLEDGQSADVTLTFTVNEGVSGPQSFLVEARTTEGVETKEVQINVMGSQAGAGFDFSGNTTLWIIGLVNVILIILIIIVAVRVSRR